MRSNLALVVLALCSFTVSPALAQVPMRAWRPPQVPHLTTGPLLGIHAVSNGQFLTVTSVRQNSPAARIGLEPGDRILEINGQSMRTLADLHQATRGAVLFNDGYLWITVENVRARYGGWGEPPYISRGIYLDGFPAGNPWNQGPHRCFPNAASPW